MEKPSTSIKELARRLLTIEAAIQSADNGHGHETVRVCEKLRISLSRFAGADGFTALMRRSLALARADFPALQTVEMRADGCIEGLEGVGAENGDGNGAGAALTAHFLWLLVIFVGEPLALRLVREAWPEISFD